MISIERVDHIGIRITDKACALRFYALLGFKVEVESDFEPVTILRNPAGVEINLIINGVDTTGGKNVLMDVPQKHPGLTHVALRVKDIRETIAALRENNITITQGPVTFGDGNVSVFVRDPDRTTLELRARMTENDAKGIEGLEFYNPKG